MKPIVLTDLARGFSVLLLTPIAVRAQVPAAPMPAPAAPPEGMGGAVAALVVPLVLLAIIVGAVKLYDRKRTRDEEATALAVRLSDALLVHPPLTGFPIIISVHLPLSRRTEPIVEVTGTVPTAALREGAVDVIRRELRSHGHIVDRVVVDPFILGRVA
jgi:hypothetical protein